VKARLFHAVGKEFPAVVVEAETTEESIILSMLCSARLTFTGETSGTGEGLTKMGFWAVQKPKE
jgi:hypothetical protein